MKDHSTPSAEQLKKRSELRRRMIDSGSFFRFIRAEIRRSRPFHRIREILALLRRFRAIAFAWRMITALFALLETGAWFLLSTALLLVLLPICAILGMIILLTAALDAQKKNRTMRNVLQNSIVYVLFLPPENAASVWETARLLAKNGTVIVISPFWITPRGEQTHAPFYFTLRRESEHIYLLRPYYFFSFKKHVLCQCKQVVYLY